MTKVYLGKPPANIEAWIKAHSSKASFKFEGTSLMYEDNALADVTNVVIDAELDSDGNLYVDAN